MRAVVIVLQLTCLAACTSLPSALPDEGWVVAVKSVRLPERDWLPWYTRFVDHSWVEVRDAQGRWWRLEFNQHDSDTGPQEISAGLAHEDVRWETCVQVHQVLCGEEAERAGARALQLAAAFPGASDYRAWPGPNSNTYVDWLAREAGIAVDLPTTAAGRDHAAWLRLGVTSTRVGVELETPYLGVQAGLREGLELHLIGLTAGVGLWPPSIKLPFLPALPWGLVGRGRAPLLPADTGS